MKGQNVNTQTAFQRILEAVAECACKPPPPPKKPVKPQIMQIISIKSWFYSDLLCFAHN